MADILLEVCVDDVAGLHAAIEGGADRIELCSALAVGGLTPSVGLMSLAGRCTVPCYAMIRPRAGDFVYCEDELAVMEDDIRFAATCGISGIVFGANHADGRLDEEVLKRLSDVVDSMPRTLHRAFDLVPDLPQAVDIAVACGFERILTSGRAPSVIEGLSDLRATLDIAGDRISIMPGAGVNLQTVDALLDGVTIKEVHSSCSSSVAVEKPAVTAFGFSDTYIKGTDIAIVRAMKARLAN